MDYTIYHMHFETCFMAYLIATISAESKEKAQGLLEKKVGSTIGFKLWETVDSGFNSDKEGIIGIGIYNERYSKLD